MLLIYYLLYSSIIGILAHEAWNEAQVCAVTSCDKLCLWSQSGAGCFGFADTSNVLVSAFSSPEGEERSWYWDVICSTYGEGKQHPSKAWCKETCILIWLHRLRSPSHLIICKLWSYYLLNIYFLVLSKILCCLRKRLMASVMSLLFSFVALEIK